MNAMFAIARREIGAYFATPIGWICLCAFAVVSGFFFFSMIYLYAEVAAQTVMNPAMAGQINVNEVIVVPFFSNLAVIALLIVPALTMRLIADDRKQKSVELLLTSPVTSLQIVLGKYLGALGFAACILATTLPFAWYLGRYGDPDPGILVANYAGFLLLMGAMMAVGLFASSLTENQIVALVIAFSLNLSVWVFGWLVTGADEGALKTVFEQVSMLTHTEQIGKGLVHASNIVYFLTFIGFFLFAATQRVEALRWR